jgi:predicted NAD/FAD-dependent oxidoreductase
MPSIAIIGAGVSGLAAANVLQDAGYAVTLFEKSCGVGGRGATRQRDGFIYDHGAQYVKEGAPEIMELITERFKTPDLIDIAKPVWIFDAQNHIQEGDPQLNAERKISYKRGLTSLSKRMAEGLHIRFETNITYLERERGGGGWQLLDTQKHVHGSFDMLLIAIPASQAGDLIDDSALDDEQLQKKLVKGLHSATYNPLISVMLGYRPCPQRRPYYALVNTDKQHPISWLAWEHEKSPERVPPGGGLLIAQMAPKYSHDHMNTPDEILVEETTHLVAQLLQEELPAPIFSDIQRWRTALPTTRADAQAINALSLPYGLAFCGDGFVGGRLHLALQHGILVAQQLIR